MKKRIAWITGDCFTETDYNFPVFSKLCESYEVHWFIVNGLNPYLDDAKYEPFKDIENLHIYIKVNPYRFRDIRGIWFWYKLHKEIKSINADKIYYNMPVIPCFALISLLMDKENTIFAAHDGKAQNDSDKFGFIRSLTYKIYYGHAKYVNMFSKAQTQLMHENFPNVKIHTMVLPLKDFGYSDLKKPDDIIRFLSFGRIIYQKNIDLLIKAGNLLYERGYRNFKISINGKADDWSVYNRLIKYPDVFECNPNFVDNNQLLDLFATSHYAVFPYRRVSQSGVLKLAFNYTLPVLVSKTGAFIEEVEDGVNGFFFEPSNLNDLTNKLEMLINNHIHYRELIKDMEIYIKKRYSIEVIVQHYRDMFEKNETYK